MRPQPLGVVLIGPTQTATEGTHSQWATRRGFAFALRLALFTAPLLASVGTVIVVSRLVGRPADLVGTLAWWVGISVVATFVMMGIDRSLRRFLPVAALFELSLVFPDQAPSRFKVALRSGTVKQFQRKLEAGETPTTQEAAEALLALSAQLGNHDRLTRGHSERVRAYSDLIAEEMKLPAPDRQKLHWAALLHDIGKLTIPAEILNKPGRPDDDEWQVLQGHPAAATSFLEPLAVWLGEWCYAATQHHERWDGRGYPDGLAGTDISVAGRIVAVADAFDTITSARSYKKAMSPADARAEVSRCSGGQFDPAVVRAFLTISLGRLRLIMGPLSWLAQTPILASVPAAGSAAVTAATAAVVTTTLAVTGSVPTTTNPAVDTLAVVTVDQAPELLAFESPIMATPPQTTPQRDGPANTAPDPVATSTPNLSAELTLLLPELNTSTPTPTASPAPGSTPTPTPTASPVPGSTPTLSLPPGSTPTSTASPAPGSTPTPTRTPTPTPSATPSPTQTPGSIVLYLTNPGSGDTTSSAVLGLSTAAPAAGSLPNYDTDRDSDPGLKVSKGDGVTESDQTKRQHWTSMLGAEDLTGIAIVELGAAVKDFEPGKTGRIQVRLRRCNAGLSPCATLGTATASFAQGAGGGFHDIVLNVTLSGGTTASQPVLQLIVATTNASDDDLWYAYDTAAQNSRVTLTLN